MGNFLTNVRRYVLPVVLVGSGVAILIAQVQGYDWLQKTWPFFIILPGLPMLYIAWNSQEPRYIRLIFPGLIVTGTGLILLYQVITEHWHSWTYAWALYAVFFGAGLIFQGRRLKEKSDVRTGRLMVLGGVVVFGILWLLMETVVFGETYQEIRGYLLSALLIGGGTLWGANKWRVARVLAKKQVIEGRPPGTPIKPQGQPQDPSSIGRFPSGVEDAPVIDSGKSGESRALPEGDPAPAKADETPEEAPQTIIAEPDASTASESASATEEDETDVISEYTPPKEIKVDGEEPSSEIDPDLQKKIDAALADDDAT